MPEYIKLSAFYLTIAEHLGSGSVGKGFIVLFKGIISVEDRV